MLTLLRKPKPKWDDLKDKLHKRHTDHASDASESRDSAAEEHVGEYVQENGHDAEGLKVGSRLLLHFNFLKTPEMLKLRLAILLVPQATPLVRCSAPCLLCMLPLV